MRSDGTGRESGSVLIWVLFLLLLAALVGALLKAAWDRDDLREAEGRNRDLTAERDDLAWRLEDAREELSQTELRRAELQRRVNRLEADTLRLEKDLAGCLNALGPARRDRDRHFEELARTSRRLEDALNELAGLSGLRDRLRELEGADAGRRQRLRSAAEKAKDLLERLRKARAELARREE